MKHDDLPERWKAKIIEHLRERGVTDRDQLGVAEFPAGSTVRIRLPDGSNAEFRWAFAIEAPELREIGVFTEHCGYHIFPGVETELTVEQ